MPMVESAFNNRQINVPPRLPFILKQFCKAAIRTQPYDLLKWSSAYFRALAEGEEPPTKIRLEYPLPQTMCGLTLGFLKVLLRQLGDYNKMLGIDTILRKWDDLCLDRRDLNLIMIIGKFRRKCQVKRFLAIAVGLLSSSLFETMLMICELLTLKPDGGSAMIPVNLFMEIYGYLAGLRCDGSKRESFEEDPSEFLIFDKVDASTTPEDIRTSGRYINDIAPVEQNSLASQDTEADVNVDLESSSKDETQSDTKVSGPSLSKELESELSSAKSGKEESSKEELERNGSSNEVTLTNKESDKHDERKSSDVTRKKLKLEDSNLLNYYPNVPGIGPRLIPEEVAAVAIWMAECAKLQEGMVGPRNLRHMQCPPLGRSDSSES